MVTPLRDGMNLVAKEYVATRTDDDGVLVLSEFAGAADELRTALLVNPHDIDGLKDAMVRAATMPRRERQKRMRVMRKRVFEYDVTRWSDSFLEELQKTHDRVDGSVTTGWEVSRVADGASADGSGGGNEDERCGSTRARLIALSGRTGR